MLKDLWVCTYYTQKYDTLIKLISHNYRLVLSNLIMLYHAAKHGDSY